MEHKVFEGLIEHCLGNIRKRKITLIFHEDSRFFYSFGAELKKSENELLIVSVNGYETDADAWIPMIDDLGNCFLKPVGQYQSDITIIEAPLPDFQGSQSETARQRLTRLEEIGHPTILLEWPLWKIPGKYSQRVEELFIKALSVDYRKMMALNREVEEIFTKGKEFRIISSSGTDLRFTKSSGPVFKEDCCFDGKLSLFQLPGGEVFFVPAPSSLKGCIVVNVKGKDHRLDIRNGYVNFSEVMKETLIAPLAEFGFGTNPNTKYQNLFDMAEKALGTCHFGFGYNKNFGGIYGESYHFDYVLQEFQLTIDERPVRILPEENRVVWGSKVDSDRIL